MGIEIKNPFTGETILEVPDPVEEAKNMFNTVTGWLNSLTSTLSNAFNGAIGWIGKMFGAVADIPAKIVGNLTTSVSTAASALGGNLRSGATDAFKGIVGTISKAFSALIEGIFPKKKEEE